MRGRLFLTTALGCVAALTPGCDRPPPAATGRADVAEPPMDSSAPPRKGLRMPLADGFEGDAVAGFWLAGNYGTGSHEPGAIVLSKDYARSGTRSARITVKEGDVGARGDDGQHVERAELDSGHYPLLGREVWGDERTARTAAVLFASCPIVLLYSATAFDAAFMTVGAFAMVALAAAPRSAAWAVVGGALRLRNRQEPSVAGYSARPLDRHGLSPPVFHGRRRDYRGVDEWSDGRVPPGGHGFQGRRGQVLP